MTSGITGLSGIKMILALLTLSQLILTGLLEALIGRFMGLDFWHMFPDKKTGRYLI
jgi:hypothetical protein